MLLRAGDIPGIAKNQNRWTMMQCQKSFGLLFEIVHVRHFRLVTSVVGLTDVQADRFVLKLPYQPVLAFTATLGTDAW